MHETFLSEDLFNILIEIEKKGKALYSTLASQSNDKNAARTLAGLADAEEKHRKLYESMKAKYIHIHSSEVSDEYRTYIQALINSSLVLTPDALSGSDNERNVLQFALSLEKDTVLFLQELKDIAPQEALENYNRVIAEEKEHIIIVQSFLEKLK